MLVRKAAGHNPLIGAPDQRQIPQLGGSGSGRGSGGHVLQLVSVRVCVAQIIQHPGYLGRQTGGGCYLAVVAELLFCLDQGVTEGHVPSPVIQLGQRVGAAAFTNAPPKPGGRQHVQVQEAGKIQLLHQFPLCLQGILLRHQQHHRLMGSVLPADALDNLRQNLSGTADADDNLTHGLISFFDQRA